jgi:hypothetical protein
MDLPINIKFTPEQQDYVLASRALAMKKPMFLILAGILLLGMIVSTVILLIPSLGGPAWGGIALIIILVGVVFISYYLFIIPFQLNSAFKKRESMQIDRELTFTDAHVVMKIGDKSGELPWENFKNVIDAGTFYLLIYEGEERIYPFVPTRAFEDEVTQDAFLELLDAKLIKRT